MKHLLTYYTHRYKILQVNKLVYLLGKFSRYIVFSRYKLDFPTIYGVSAKLSNKRLSCQERE